MQSKPKFQKNEGQALLIFKLVALLFFNPFWFPLFLAYWAGSCIYV